jgi:hypothetical protein
MGGAWLSLVVDSHGPLAASSRRGRVCPCLLAPSSLHACPEFPGRASRGTLQIGSNHHSQSLNSSVLHRKECFLLTSNPLYGKFARLTSQEDKHGLLDDPNNIGTREGWARRLAERGFSLRGHRLVRLDGKAARRQIR